MTTRRIPRTFALACLLLASAPACGSSEQDEGLTPTTSESGNDETSTSAPSWDERPTGDPSDSSGGDEPGDSSGTCEPACGDRSCGVDPVCGMPCGSCDEGQTCDDSGACVDAPVQCAANLLVESFESADMSVTNADGFSWGNNNRTSVVTMDPGPVAVYNNGAIDTPGPDGADWTAFDGEHSLRFRYPAGEFWSEQRFDMGGAYPEIWIRYWLRVPDNFAHGDTSPTNNKFFALWMDGYSQHGEGPTIVWNFWRQDDTDDSVFTYSVGETAQPSGGHHAEYRDFIRSPEDQGRWMQVVLYAKMSTSDGALDGESRIWRRWEDEAGFTLIAETTDKDFSPPPDGPLGWHAGYVLGWSNPGYDEDTEWLLDGFELSTEPLNCGF